MSLAGSLLGWGVESVKSLLQSHTSHFYVRDVSSAECDKSIKGNYFTEDPFLDYFSVSLW